ncbi:cell division protein FtsL [Blochmannia endosymbiont of Polyrhachis (Hedomyrma) turneri]|nr:cell division protein FtsL [Blochmannia endosymbiont of Polyrhachis (Hedomyrma) turneri]
MNNNFGRLPNLVRIICCDLFYRARLCLILLFLVICSGISVVIMTYKTRELIMFSEQIVLEKDALEIENHHLMLEEKVLGDLTRIESFAIKKLNMKYVDPYEEIGIYYYN